MAEELFEGNIASEMTLGEHRDETIKIHSFKAKEKFSFKNESDLRDTFLSLYKQCRGYKEIFRDGQDTIRRNFNFEKQCDISFENTKSVNFVVQLIISYDDRPRFTITVSGDTPRALNKFGVKYFEEIFKPYMVEKLESSSKEYSNTYEIIDQSE